MHFSELYVQHHSTHSEHLLSRAAAGKSHLRSTDTALATSAPLPNFTPGRFNSALSSLLPKPPHFQTFLSASPQCHPFRPQPAPPALVPAPCTDPRVSPRLRPPWGSPLPLRSPRAARPGPARLCSHLRARPRPRSPLTAGPARLAPAPGASGSRGPVPQRLRLQPSPARSVPRAAAAAGAGRGRAGSGPGRAGAALRGSGGPRSPRSLQPGPPSAQTGNGNAGSH